jgi:phosphoglycerate dehydrogenase-like enzyme
LRTDQGWVDIRPVNRTVWTNHTLQPAAERHLRTELERRGDRLIQSSSSSKSVLLPGVTDPGLADADIAYGQPDPADVMRYGRIRWVALSTAGYTRYDRDDFRQAMADRGTVVTNASSVFADPCAQHVIAGMLAMARNLPSQLRNQDGPREWRYLEDRFTASVLTGQTVVFLGFGAIGRRLACLLEPWGLRMLAYRRRSEACGSVEVITGSESLDLALASADHVVDLLPDSPATRGFVGASRISRFKHGARFYNIGRGTTVDQGSLIKALDSGRVGGAYLDVMDPEPLPQEHPLWRATNCFITCHVGGGTADQDDQLVGHFLRNLDRWDAGRSLEDKILSGV